VDVDEMTTASLRIFSRSAKKGRRWPCRDDGEDFAAEFAEVPG
jgi:hypothetical protein